MSATQLLGMVSILARIARAYHDNNLDDEARKFIFPNGDDKPVFATVGNPHDIVLYSGRGGTLLTLGDCLEAEKLMREYQGEATMADVQGQGVLPVEFPKPRCRGCLGNGKTKMPGVPPHYISSEQDCLFATPHCTPGAR